MCGKKEKSSVGNYYKKYCKWSQIKKYISKNANNDIHHHQKCQNMKKVVIYFIM